ncbi:glycosyltransferase family 4 protein [Clostridium butyricum]|uniref:glycosyltransferase family 4 protein n=1 Tax=Clostridium butyricum TaxID=1492 RepID=UPI00374FAF75
MKIAYFSPLNPLKSGISDFSEELLMELKKYVDIDLFVDNISPSNNEIVKNFKIYNIEEFDKKEVRDRYDEYIYHVGNNMKCNFKIAQYSLKYPGILELHDISLHHMLAEVTLVKGYSEGYVDEMEYCHGNIGKEIAQQFINGEIREPWEDKSLQFTVNKRYIDKSKAIIVHSDFAKQIIKGISNKPVKKIFLHTNDIESNYEEIKFQIRKKYNIDLNEIILASFGFVTAPKRILQIIEALGKLKEDGYNFKYYIVGEVDKNLNLNEKIKDLHLEKDIIITGFVNLDEFKEYMKICDICLNLRYPTQGESSASLHRILGMGKVTFVSDVGSFKEYPDDVVIKISTDNSETNDIYINLINIIKNKKNIGIKKEKSIQFAKDSCSLEKNAKIYKEFLEVIHNRNYYESDILDNIADKLYELGIYDHYSIDSIYKKIQLFIN